MDYVNNNSNKNKNLNEKKVINKLIVHPSFIQTLEEINRINIRIPPNPSFHEMVLQNYVFPPNGELVTPIDEIQTIKLNPKNGEKLTLEKRPIVAYDESINKFACLEGIAYYSSHSIVVTEKDDFVPMNFLTFYFYTRSQEITGQSDFIKFSSDPDMDSKKDFITDKINMLTEYTPSYSLLFIDGPLIGGDVYTFMIRAIKKFLTKNIIPLFFVKNSTSNLVTDNVPELKNKFNSDLHWAYNFLEPGYRTNFFRYVDKKNPHNAKIFCYLKGFNLSPQRIEFHVDTYNNYSPLLPSIMDLAYYLLLVQGDLKNPQIRHIAIAEKYARATLNLVNIFNLMKEAGITPTMNQERFGT